MTYDPKVYAAFLGAADYIDEYGWTQREYRNPLTGCVCADGALQAALGAAVSPTGDGFLVGEIWTGPYLAAWDYLRTFTLGKYSSGDPIHWNDAPGRTKAEVTRMFRDAARAYKEEYMNEES